MSDPTPLPQITPEMLAAARELYAGQVSSCPHCDGWSKPDPRQSPVRYDSVICLSEARDTWYVRCFSCYACTSSTNTAAEALERWNRRVGDLQARQLLLPLVDLQAIARKHGLTLTEEIDAFAMRLQLDVLRLNRRPTQ